MCSDLHMADILINLYDVYMAIWLYIHQYGSLDGRAQQWKSITVKYAYDGR